MTRTRKSQLPPDSARPGTWVSSHPAEGGPFHVLETDNATRVQRRLEESARRADDVGVIVSPQEKAFWVDAGAEKEVVFVEQVLPQLGFRGELNPAKAGDRYAPDLVVEGHLADLKCQRTPFFKAQELHRVDPQFAVTFNEKDFQRYRANYPSLDIFFWVAWQTCEKKIGDQVYAVKPMAGVWKGSFPAMRRRIEEQRVGAHAYLQRLFDQQGNAKQSFVFDLRRFEFLGGSAVARDAVLWSR